MKLICQTPPEYTSEKAIGEDGYLAFRGQHSAIKIKSALHHDNTLRLAFLVRCGQYFCGERCSVDQHSSYVSSEFAAKLCGDLYARSAGHL